MSYLELTSAPAPVPARAGDERICAQKLNIEEYLELYMRVGEPLRWDQRLKMPRADLIRLLESERNQLYVLRDRLGGALGFCEFERALPEIELKNFGLIRQVQGRGLGLWLLLTTLHQEWERHPRRIWLHTDEWDHPSAIAVYQRAGFHIYMVRDELPADL